MTTEPNLRERTFRWVTENFSNANHLVQAEVWLLRLQPDAPEALRLAF